MRKRKRKRKRKRERKGRDCADADGCFNKLVYGATKVLTTEAREQRSDVGDK